MNHREWIKKQFKYTVVSYRNVLIHASFVETVTREEAKENNFKCAIKILKANNKYNSDKIDIIDKLRIKRNIILHDLLKDKKLDQELIDSTIREMEEFLKEIYHNSSFIQRYFKKKYKIDIEKFN